MSHAFAAGRYAAIDIGTVTSRMLAADITEEGTLIELARGYAITNLGEGVDVSHRLLPEAIGRVAVAVADFMDTLKELGPDAQGRTICVRAVTTSAARDAQNASDLVGRLAELGVDLQIIRGEREAALSFAGVSSAFGEGCLAVADVGGGSTEIVAGTVGEAPSFVHSFDIGCRRATERYLQSDPPTVAEMDRARSWIREELAAVPGLSDALAASRLVAVAGTATTAVAIREALEEYDSARVHMATVTQDDLERLCNRMASMTLAERRHVAGLDPKRAPVIVAGLLILQEVVRAGAFESFTVSESDILAGITYDAAKTIEG